MPTPDRRSWSARTVVISVVVLLLAVAVGVYGGLRAPGGTKQPQVKAGVAMRANDENGLLLFDADDGTQLTLYAEGLWWEAESSSGAGDPPCLTEPGTQAPVEVGFLWVAGPTGGARVEPVWVRCL